jgi:crotonobetainyl-CoA:carnitine CoA-transferase CaiB-like acyl-CoA transferase
MTKNDIPTCSYDTHDKRILINTDEDEWFRAACEQIDAPELLTDPRFSSIELRRSPSFDDDDNVVDQPGENWVSLHQLIADKVAGLSGAELAPKILAAGGIADAW